MLGRESLDAGNRVVGMRPSRTAALSETERSPTALLIVVTRTAVTNHEGLRSVMVAVHANP
jgi:hypothetical protein